MWSFMSSGDGYLSHTPPTLGGPPSSPHPIHFNSLHLIFSYSHILIFSYSHILIFSYSHILIESCSHGVMESWSHGVMESWISAYTWTLSADASMPEY